jgi:hypothetical protein
MTISIVVTTLPADGGSPITGIDYRINGGSAVGVGAAVPGTYATTAVFGDNVEIRAVNAIGAGPWSAAKNIPALGFFAPLTTQAFTDNSGNQTYVFPAATGAGLTWTYALTSPPSGVTINSATRTITFDTNAMAPQSGTVITVTATDSLGRAATGSPRTFALTIGVGAVNPVLDAITFADPGNATPDTLTTPYSYSSPPPDTLVAGVVIRNGGTALTNAQVRDGTGTFLERVVIDPFSVANFDLSGFTATSNAGTAIDVAIWEKNNGGLSNVQTVAVSGLDFTAPTLSSTVPADGATNVAVNANSVFTFSENVFPGSGLFRLRNTTANTQIETFNPATGTGSSGGTISIAGAVVTINPFADKLNSTDYAWRWDAGALLDQDGNPFAANTADTAYNFTTAAADTGAFSDDFNRADGALGANWSVYQAEWFGNPNPGFQIGTNRLEMTAGTTTGGEMIRTTTSISGGAFVQATFVSETSGAEWGIGIVDTATNRQAFFYVTPASGAREIIRRQGTGTTTFGTSIASASSSAVPSDTVIRLERTIIDASTVRYRVLQGGSQIISFDDTDANRVSGDVFGFIVGSLNNTAKSFRFDSYSQGAV